MTIPVIGLNVQTALFIFGATALAMYLYSTNKTFQDFIGDGYSNKIGVGR